MRPNLFVAVCLALLPAACLFAESDVRNLIVAADGSGQFKSVQAAIEAAPENSNTRTVITIHPGTYKERVIVPKNKPMLTLRGASGDPSKTVLTYDWSTHTIGPDGKTVGTTGSCSTLVSAPDFTAEHVTFENTAGEVGQALALLFSSDRGVFRNCRFHGWQDTLCIHDRRVYFKDCYIEGRVDFIFGKSTAVFEHCRIHSKNGGYITAAATPRENPFGYVFLHCKLTGTNGRAFLGRAWRPHAAVSFVNCELGEHIRPEGWRHWRDTLEDGRVTARFGEYGCIGPGANPEARVEWSRQLSHEEAKKHTVSAILGGEDHWDPTAAP